LSLLVAAVVVLSQAAAQELVDFTDLLHKFFLATKLLL
jgi:hypothetical protein